MRRAEREVTELNQLEEILRECQVVRIGAQDQEGLFVVPVNFGYRLEGRELTLYFHSAREGRKAAAFRTGGRVAFEMDCGHSLYTADTACGHSYLFRSIMGSGDIRALESRAEKREGLNAVMLHLTGRAWEMPDAALDGVEVFAIRADSWTGKHNQM